MFEIFSWYLFSLLLGWINFPLVFHISNKLHTRGYHLIRPLGLLLWGYIFWLTTSLGLTENSLASQLSCILILVGINALMLFKIGLNKVKDWIRQYWKLILVIETLFLTAFAFWALVRSANPQIVYTEKYMEMAFINAILKSESFPPLDPWLSGYGISYYYFGYLLTAMLVRITDVISAVGYNLMSAFIFALTFIGAYGILLDLWLIPRSHSNSNSTTKKSFQWIYLGAILAPIMMLIVSNWFGVLDILHSRGLGQDSQFWSSLKIPDLIDPPTVQSWWPERGGWSWWQASRVVQDFSLNGTRIEIIDEFPFFTFLLSDLHPHMLNMPFVLLAISFSLNAILGGWVRSIKIYKWEIPFNPIHIFLGLLTLGGIGFMNTWDFPFYLVLMAASLAFPRVQKFGWSAKRVGEFFLTCILGGFSSIFLFIPFYLSFASQAGGILPSLAFFTQGKYFWIMFGPLIVPIIAYLIQNMQQITNIKLLRTSFIISVGLILFLFLFSWLLGLVGANLPNLGSLLLNLQGAVDANDLMVGSITKRLSAPGTAVILFLMATLGIYLLLRNSSLIERDNSNEVSVNIKIFLLFLILLGTLLALGPEFLYLRDQFGNRMNTIFKFYYQVWILWSLAASYAILSLFKSQQKKLVLDFMFSGLIFCLGFLAFSFSLRQDNNLDFVKFGSNFLDIIIILVPLTFLAWLINSILKRDLQKSLAIISLFAVALGLVYPVIETWNKTQGFSPSLGFTLDGRYGFLNNDSDIMSAAEWLSNAPLGVMVEAVSETGGSYTTYNSISTFSGMPTVLGWVGHESQWRGGYTEIANRKEDIKDLYSTQNWERAFEVIEKYQVRYIVIGNLEKQTYLVSEDKFTENLKLVLSTDTVNIYQVY